MEAVRRAAYTDAVADTILPPRELSGEASRSGCWPGGITIPASLLEHAVFWGIAGQFVFYFAGLAPVAPLLTAGPAMALATVRMMRERVVPHWLAALWFVCTAGVLVQMLAVFWLKGVGGWYVPGWFLTFAPAAFLPMAGAFVRKSVVFSAVAVLGIQALIYAAIAGPAVAAGIDPAYPSPIPVSRMIDPAFHSVRLTQPPEIAGDERRLVAFTPFPTSAGAAACVFALLTLCHRRSWSQVLGLAGWLALLALTHVRTGLVCITVGAALYYALLLPRRHLFFGAGVALLLAAAFTGPLLRGAELANRSLRSQRPSSSQDRANLHSLAWEGWLYGDGPVLGAGASVRGGPIVRDVGIGTHDWAGANLFIRGALGFGLTLLPVVVTLVFGFFAGLSPGERGVTAVAAVLLIYTYSQELQTLYIYIWPLFLLIGAIARRTPPAVAAPLFTA